MKTVHLINKLLSGVIASFCFITSIQAGTPLWTFTPNTSFPPKVTISPSGTATVKYTVTNQEKHILSS